VLIDVEDLSDASQALLARIVEEQHFTPVNDFTPIKFDVRLISTAHPQLKEMMEKGQFRSDLFHALSEQLLSVPSLNQCKHDMSSIVTRELQEIGAAYAHFDSSAVERLKQYQFTGNYRELRNILKRVVSWFDEEKIDARMVEFVLNSGAKESQSRPIDDWKPQNINETSTAVLFNCNEKLSLKEVEKRYWSSLMQGVDGNKQKAADIAGVSLRTLYRRLEAAGLHG
jgi:DNA-binding NtrC family response regulator